MSAIYNKIYIRIKNIYIRIKLSFNERNKINLEFSI